MNCIDYTLLRGCQAHQFHLCSLVARDLQCWHQLRSIGTYNRHELTCAHVSCARFYRCRSSDVRFDGSLVVSVSFKESPSVAHRSITLCYVSDSPVNLLITIKILIGFITHLAYAVMWSVARLWIPLSILFVYQLIKALILLIINNPWMCIELEWIALCSCFCWCCG